MLTTGNLFMSDDKTHLIFVYGTLKQGWNNHVCIEGQKYLGVAETNMANYQMYSLGGFPGVVKDGDKHIIGELYEVDDAHFARCDRLEGHPSFYRREQIQVLDIDDNIYIPWIYIYQGDVSRCEPIEVW